jgi:hypothetical protein
MKSPAFSRSILRLYIVWICSTDQVVLSGITLYTHRPTSRFEFRDCRITSFEFPSQPFGEPSPSEGHRVVRWRASLLSAVLIAGWGHIETAVKSWKILLEEAGM